MMAHFAQIDEQGTVVQIIVVNNEDILDENDQESEALGQQICNSILEGTWVQTSYNGNTRKQYAVIGGRYDAVNDVFISPKPYPSWSLDENFDWQAPVPMPDPCDDCADGHHEENDCECGKHVWNEDAQRWTEILSIQPE